MILSYAQRCALRGITKSFCMQQHTHASRQLICGTIHLLSKSSGRLTLSALAYKDTVTSSMTVVSTEDKAPEATEYVTVSQMRPLREKTKELQSSHEAQVTSVLEKYKTLRAQVQDYHQLLEAAMTPTASAAESSLSSAVKAITLR